MIKLLSFILFIFYSSFAFSAESRNFARSPKGLLMGDAYTSIADDEYTLYYNPAILARHKGFSFWAINPSISVSNILDDPDKFNNTGSTSTALAEKLFDFPIHIGVNAAPGFKMGRFGFTGIVNSVSNINILNNHTPMLDIDHRFDKGFIAGYGMPLNGDLAVGFSAKYIQRESLFGTYNLFSKTVMDAVASGEVEEILSNLGQVKGSGWGFDLGFDYVKQSGPSMFTMGLSFLDIYTILHTDANIEDREVQPQPMQVNFGSSISMQAAGFGFRFSGDLRNLEQQMDFMQRVRLGGEMMVSPALSVLVGMNSGGYSYGIKTDLGLVNIYAGFYSEDTGEKVNQQKVSRAVIYLSLFDFNFDV